MGTLSTWARHRRVNYPVPFQVAAVFAYVSAWLSSRKKLSLLIKLQADTKTWKLRALLFCTLSWLSKNTIILEWYFLWHLDDYLKNTPTIIWKSEHTNNHMKKPLLLNWMLVLSRQIKENLHRCWNWSYGESSWRQQYNSYPWSSESLYSSGGTTVGHMAAHHFFISEAWGLVKIVGFWVLKRKRELVSRCFPHKGVSGLC